MDGGKLSINHIKKEMDKSALSKEAQILIQHLFISESIIFIIDLPGLFKEGRDRRIEDALIGLWHLAQIPDSNFSSIFILLNKAEELLPQGTAPSIEGVKTWFDLAIAHTLPDAENQALKVLNELTHFDINEFLSPWLTRIGAKPKLRVGVFFTSTKGGLIPYDLGNPDGVPTSIPMPLNVVEPLVYSIIKSMYPYKVV